MEKTKSASMAKPARKKGRKKAVKSRKKTQSRVRQNTQKINRLLLSREIKQAVSGSNSSICEFAAGAASTGPSNSLVILPILFEGTAKTPDFDGLAQGNRAINEVTGNYITLAYPTTMKLRVEWHQLTVDNGQLVTCNARLITGYIKTTGYKSGHDLSSYSSWTAANRATAYKFLYEAGFDADFLTFTKKSKDVVVHSNRLIAPELKSYGAMLAANQVAVPPPTQLTVKFVDTAAKTKLSITGDGKMVPNDSWIPFALVLAPRLTSADDGHIRVGSVSRSYYSDA